jgi:hypothetical protein
MPLAASLPLPLMPCKLTLAWPLHSQRFDAGCKRPAWRSAVRMYAAAALYCPPSSRVCRHCSCHSKEANEHSQAAGELCLLQAAEVLW